MSKKICSRFRLIKQDEQNEVRWMLTLYVKMSQLREKILTQISNKVIPVHSDAYFSRYDHFHFEKVLLISTYENNIRFSKKQDKARYLARTNTWVIWLLKLNFN